VGAVFWGLKRKANEGEDEKWEKRRDKNDRSEKAE